MRKVTKRITLEGVTDDGETPHVFEATTYDLPEGASFSPIKNLLADLGAEKIDNPQPLMRPFSRRGR